MQARVLADRSSLHRGEPDGGVYSLSDYVVELFLGFANIEYRFAGSTRDRAAQSSISLSQSEVSKTEARKDGNAERGEGVWVSWPGVTFWLYSGRPQTGRTMPRPAFLGRRPPRFCAAPSGRLSVLGRPADPGRSCRDGRFPTFDLAILAPA